MGNAAQMARPDWRRAIPLALTVVAGVLIPLASPSPDLGFLAWVVVAPFLFAVRQVRPLAAAALGWLFGSLYALGVFYWINAVPSVELLSFIVMVLAWGVYFLVFGFVYNVLSGRMGAWSFAGAAAAWVGLEYARGNLGFLSLPWNFIGHTQYKYLPVIQIVDVTGAYGVSCLLIMVNELVSRIPELLAHRRPQNADARHDAVRWAPLAVIPLAVAVTLGYGWYRLATPSATSGQLRVAIVQANIVTRANMSVPDQFRHLSAYMRLSRVTAASKPDLIIWPSSSLPAPLASVPVHLFVARVAQETGAHVLVGGAGGEKFAPPRDGQRQHSNSAFLIAPSGAIVDQYNKIQLTPFNEYVPLAGTITWPRWMTTLTSSFMRGDAYTLFRVSDATFGAPICWEAAFPDLFRRFVQGGANLMVNVTNEAAFGATGGPRQTLAMNVFRAAENRVPIARAATTGISGFIAPTGKISRVTDQGRDLFVAGTLVADVSLSRTKTFYTEHGDLFVAFLVGTVATGVGAQSIARAVVRMRRSVPRVALR